MAYSSDKSFSPKYDDYSKDVVVDTYATDKVYGGDAGTQVAGQQYAPSTSPDADIMTGHHLKKSLRWWDLLGLGIGCIIGAGIFVTTGRVFTNVTGPAIVISYVVAGTCCAFASLCYSEFAAMAPSSGSAYAFTSQTLGEIPAMMVGWNLALEYAVSSATVTQGFSAYFQTFVGLCGGNIFPRNADPNSPSYMNTGASGSGNQWISYTFWDYAQGSGPFLTGSAVDLWAMLLAICLGCLVTWGVNESARFNNIMVVVKVTIVLFVISLGAYYSTAGFTPFAPYGFGGLQFFGNKAFGQSNADGAPIGMLAGASTVFFAYIGFDAVTAQSEEAKNPGRDLPIGIIGSLVISTCLYIAVCLVLSAMIPYEWYMPGSTGLADRGISRGSILADIFTFYGQRWAAFVVCIGAIAGLTSVTLVTMMGQPRIFMAMARDGLLPKFFCEIHPKTQTPYKACILFTVFITTLAGILPGNVLLDMTNIGTLFAFTFVCISLPIYRYMNPDRPRPFKAPLSSWKFPLVPVLGAGLSIILAFSLDSQNWYRLLGWMGAGALLYILWGRRNARKVREMKAALPAAQQFHQGPDLEYNNQHGITTDSLSDPSEGVHKDNIGDSAYIPHHHQHHDAAAPSYGQPQAPAYNNNAVYV